MFSSYFFNVASAFFWGLCSYPMIPRSLSLPTDLFYIQFLMFFTLDGKNIPPRRFFGHNLAMTADSEET